MALDAFVLPALAKLQDELMPRRCVFCGTGTDPGEVFVCIACNADLPRIRNPCVTCGVPLATLTDVPCGSCQQAPPPFATVVAPFEYNFPLDAAIKALKFHRKLFYLAAFEPLLLEAAARLPAGIDAVLPVPLHRWRRIRRGFNQAEELAKPVADLLGLEYLTGARRIVNTPYQSGLDGAERQRNLSRAFVVDSKVTARHVLIVDDVITTGATGHSLARALKKAGVEKVSMLALARA